MRKNAIAFTIFIYLLSSCTPNNPEMALPAEADGYVPVYASAASSKVISAESPRATVNAGKIYTTGNLLFQVEADSGIHVINYANPANPNQFNQGDSGLLAQMYLQLSKSGDMRAPIRNFIRSLMHNGQTPP